MLSGRFLTCDRSRRQVKNHDFLGHVFARASAPIRGRSFSYFRVLGHRLIRSQPDTKRREFHRGEEVIVSFIVSRGDGAEVFDFVEEPFDSIALAVEPIQEGWTVFPVGHQAYIALCTALFEALTQAVTIAGTVRQKDVPALDGPRTYQRLRAHRGYPHHKP